MNIVNSKLVSGENKHYKSVLMRKINTETRLNCVTIDLQLLLAPKCVKQQDQVPSRFAHISSFRTLQYIHIIYMQTICGIFVKVFVSWEI
jgi:hypothetical protein